jgi:hypothetical protein
VFFLFEKRAAKILPFFETANTFQHTFLKKAKKSCKTSVLRISDGKNKPFIRFPIIFCRCSPNDYRSFSHLYIYVNPDAFLRYESQQIQHQFHLLKQHVMKNSNEFPKSIQGLWIFNDK